MIDKEKQNQRIFAKVEPTGFCWLWVGGINNYGYGQTSYNGVNQSAHRAVYQILIGPIPEGLQLDHLCHIRDCVNPDHLEPVTKRENAARMVDRHGWTQGGKDRSNFIGPLPKPPLKKPRGSYKLTMSQREKCKNGHLIAVVGVRVKTLKGKQIEICEGCHMVYRNTRNELLKADTRARKEARQ